MMKKLLVILIALPMIGFGQNVGQKIYMPDDTFEYWCESSGYGDGISNNDSIFKLNAEMCGSIIFTTPMSFPEDYTGIEYFSELEIFIVPDWNGLHAPQPQNYIKKLDLSNNINLKKLEIAKLYINSLDLSNNINLEHIRIYEAFIPPNSPIGSLGFVNIDLSNNIKLKYLWLEKIPLSSLNINSNTLLEYLQIRDTDVNNFSLVNNNFLQEVRVVSNDNVSYLDFSNNILLESVNLGLNSIVCVDLRKNNLLSHFSFNHNGGVLFLNNGNNINLTGTINQNVNCVQVDSVGFNPGDFGFTTVNPPVKYIYSNTSPSNFCTHGGYNSCVSATNIDVIYNNENKRELLKVTDLLGRETKGTKNEVLFYIYDDGTVEKRIIIE